MISFSKILQLSIYLVLLFAVACTSPDKANQKQNPAKSTSKSSAKKKKTKKQKKPRYPELTPENSIEFLTEYGKKNPETIVEIITSYGNIKMRLFEDTPIHRANFIYLTKRKFFDMTVFYRVAENFVCQAGNSDDYETQVYRKEIGRYILPSEFRPHHIHEVGAVAAARQYINNPNKNSSAFEFYITLGPTYNDGTIRAIAQETGVKYTRQQLDTYIEKGGQPTLDQEHTVFGEVIEGMDVVYEINKVKVDGRDWPHDDIPIDIRVVE